MPEAIPAQGAPLAELLGEAARHRIGRLESQLLLLHALGVPPQEAAARRGWLLAHGDTHADPAQVERFRQLVEAHRDGLPLAYARGWQAFHGLWLKVDQRVLIPRSDTETLVDWALDRLAGMPPPQRVLDLGTGSGAIALALKKACPSARVIGLDRSRDALAVASANAATLNLDIELRWGDWLQGLDGSFDLIVSNPPYVAAQDPHLQALSDEPIEALVAGPDGLDDIRTLVRDAGARLVPGGMLMLEHGWDQAPAIRALLAEHGYGGIETRRDLAGHERCSGAVMRPAAAIDR